MPWTVHYQTCPPQFFLCFLSIYLRTGLRLSSLGPAYLKAYKRQHRAYERQHRRTRKAAAKSKRSDLRVWNTVYSMLRKRGQHLVAPCTIYIANDIDATRREDCYLRLLSLLDHCSFPFILPHGLHCGLFWHCVVCTRLSSVSVAPSSFSSQSHS